MLRRRLFLVTLPLLCSAAVAACGADDDAGSGELVEANRELLARALGDRYPPFAEAVRNFDFPAALALLRQAG